MNREDLKRIIQQVVLEMDENDNEIPIGISNRHIHLSQEDYNILFPNQEIEKKKALYQPGEFASEQTVTISGLKGKIAKVRLLVPLRKATQVEISKTDARKLGIDAQISMSGDLTNAKEITIETPDGSIIRKCCIVAKRHIHMSTNDTEKFGVKQGDIVKVEIETSQRKTIYDDVVVRPHPNFLLEMHLDTDEANAANVSPHTKARIVK